MQPVTTSDVIQLLDDRVAFLQANFRAGLLPDRRQVSNFLATLVAQTGPWAASVRTAPEHRDRMLQMFLALHWDCVNNTPIPHLPPPLPYDVLDALVRQKRALDRALWQLQQRESAGPLYKRARIAPQERDIKRLTPPVFGEAPPPGSSPAVLLIFDLNGTVLTRRRAGGNPTPGSSTPQIVLVNGKPMMLRPHLKTLLETIAASARGRSDSSASCVLTAGVWTSAMAHNMLPMVSAAFGSRAALELRFTAHREHCSPLSAVQAQQQQQQPPQRQPQRQQQQPQQQQHGTVKDLERVWEQHPAFDAKTTVLIDDSDVKALLQPRNLLLVPSFDQEPLPPSGDERRLHDSDDDVLLGLSVYLEELQAAMITAFESTTRTTEPPDVRLFLAEHPFGTWLAAWRTQRHKKQAMDQERNVAAANAAVSANNDNPEVAPSTAGDTTCASRNVAACVDSARLEQLLDGAPPKNRAERRALANVDRAELLRHAKTTVGNPSHQALESHCKAEDGVKDGQEGHALLDASKSQGNTIASDKADDHTTSARAMSACSSTEDKKRKKPRWTKEEKRLRQRQPRGQQLASESVSASSSNAIAATLASSLPPSKPVAATTQLSQWNGSVFCNPFREVAQAVGVVPPGSCGAPTSADISTLDHSTCHTNGSTGNGRSISVQRLCRLPQIAACRLQAESVCQVVAALSHERMKLSKDGQMALVIDGSHC